MVIRAPKKIVGNWFEHQASFSLEYLRGFIENVERQIDQDIKRYDAEIEIREEVFVVDGVEYCHGVRYWRGLDGETWDIHKTVRLYFPNLQRRSALLTLFGYFEHELDQLCSLYRSENEYKISLTDIKGQGIDRSTRYLKKVADIDTNKNSDAWVSIKKVQNIRNLIVHRDGNLVDTRDNRIQEAIKFINQAEFLDGETEVILKEGFLRHVLKTFGDYFKLLDRSIQKSAQ
jgi:hypothetical protein